MLYARHALVAVLAFAGLANMANAGVIEPGLARKLRQESASPANIIVTMKGGNKAGLDAASRSFTGGMSRGKKIEALVDNLAAATEASQQDILRALNQESSTDDFQSYKSFWISNQLYISGASPALIQKLQNMHNVAEVREEQILPYINDELQVSASNNSLAANEWGVEKVAAPAVWEMGYNGKNVRVGIIDSGVFGTHEILAKNFGGEFSWFDPEKKADAPYDVHGHGTHCMGTIAGANGVGVAPGATWMACKGCRSSGCPEADLLSCAEFMTCPTDPTGTKKDCEKAPGVINNSWGGGRGDTFYKAAVDAWRKAGIIPVFANGNSGPSCDTANSPGDLPTVIGVGATDSSDAIASFSSKGPAKSGILKPDVSAPGVNIRSSLNKGVSSYGVMSGTSMASPHTTGVVALLLSAKPGLTFDEVYAALTKTSFTATKPSGKTCGGISDSAWPNNVFGYGRIDAQSACKGSGPSPTSAPTSNPTSAPVVPTPRPTTSPTSAPTPKPSDPASGCDGLSLFPCLLNPGCSFDWSSFECVSK